MSQNVSPNYEDALGIGDMRWLDWVLSNLGVGEVAHFRRSEVKRERLPEYRRLSVQAVRTLGKGAYRMKSDGIEIQVTRLK